MERYIPILCSAATLIVVLILLLRQRGGGALEAQLFQLKDILDGLQRQQSDEFERNRRELSEVQNLTRTELGENLRLMQTRIQELTEKNHSQLQGVTDTLSKSLDHIRRDQFEQNDRQSKQLAESLERMRAGNEQKLEQMRVTVDEKLQTTLNTRLDSSFKTVSDQLEKVYTSLGEMKELSSGVTNNVSSLSRILTNVKARGTWAESQLANILDQTIPNMYERNFAADESSRERVEFAVRIPNGEGETAYLPIDSKFPTEDYQRLCEAAEQGADAAEIQRLRRELEKRVLEEAKTISKYIRVPRTTPFAIMYLATEGLYAEIASSPNGLPERMQNELQVMIAGPITVTALLNTIAMGMRTVAINEKANEIRLLLGAAKKQYEVFGGLLDKAKQKVEEAGKTLGEAQKRNDLIQKKLKGVEVLGEEEAQLALPFAQEMVAEGAGSNE